MKAYIYGLFENDEEIDRTSLDEMNENLAYDIMVRDEGRTECKHLEVAFIEEVEEADEEWLLPKNTQKKKLCKV